jgi:hypothetical protein
MDKRTTRSLSLLRKYAPRIEGQVLPEPSFHGTYKTDYNILIMDSKIKKYLLSLKNRVGPLKLELANYRERVPEASVSEQSFYKGMISNLRLEIKDCRNLTKYNDYIESTSGLIKRYSSTETPKHPIIDAYLAEASKYAHVEVSRVPSKVEYCECGESLNDSNVREECVDCHNCGRVISCNYTDRLVKDAKYIDMNMGSQPYDEVIKKMLSEYQGKIEAPDETILRVDEYLHKNGMYPDDPSELHYTSNGKLEGTSVTMMKKILEKVGMKSEKKSVHYICSMCWGWKLQDISHIEMQVLVTYKQIRAVFNEKYKKQKTPNSFFIYKILLEYGVQCDDDDFGLPKSPACKSDLEEKWRTSSKGVSFC